MPDIHPFYELHRATMESALAQRVDLAEGLLREALGIGDVAPVKREIMAEFETVLTQMPYVGGAESRMTDFFMRLLGFMAVGRVLRRHGVPSPAIREIAVESLKAQLLLEPEEKRLAAGRQFMSPENRAAIRAQAALSQKQTFAEDFGYDVVEPGPGDAFDFGVNYRQCGFCKFADKYGDREILPSVCAIDFVAYETRGIHLERTQTIAGGASHCNFRFSQK
jgi:hypothetical protein